MFSTLYVGLAVLLVSGIVELARSQMPGIGQRIHMLAACACLGLFALGSWRAYRMELADELVDACAHGDAAAVSRLLASGANPDAEDEFGTPPVQAAGTNTTIVKLLMDHGLDTRSSAFLRAIAAARGDVRRRRSTNPPGVE